MAAEGEAMHEAPAPLAEELGDPVVDQHRAERRVAAADRLAAGDHVRRDAPVADGEGLAGAAVAGQHLVGNEQHAVAVAYLAHALVVVLVRHQP